MKHKQLGTLVLSPCQIVAWNLERLRKARGWSQDQAAKELEPYLGYRLSRAAFSQAERSLDGGKIRRFDADEIVAFSRVFEVPVGCFFGPPAPHLKGKSVAVNGKPGNPEARVTSPPLSRDDMLTLAESLPDPATLKVIAEPVVEKLQQVLSERFGRYLEQHMNQFARLPSEIPSEFWASMRSEQETNTTATAERCLADQAMARIEKDRSRPQPKLLTSADGQPSSSNHSAAQKLAKRAK
jgi:transcriptional regulator with XRE-family HTH domain